MTTTPSAPSEVSTLREHLQWLERRVRLLEQSAHSAQPVDPRVDESTEKQIIALTQQIFPGEVKIEYQFDPEYPGYVYSMVCASAVGEIEEIADRRAVWHKRMWETFNDDRIWRLALSHG